jgi:chemotaxis protein MotA
LRAVDYAADATALSSLLRTPAPVEAREGLERLADALQKIALDRALSAFGLPEVNSAFLQKGIQLLVDGHDPDVVKTMMSKDKKLAEDRHNNGSAIFAALAEMAPAMGMIGTLIGLVAMLANMDDPKAIGPAMAVALLTTLYGAVLANALFGPIADKLKLRAKEEAMSKSLIVDALLAIQSGQNPRVIDSMLRTYLPEGKREVADAG